VPGLVEVLGLLLLVGGIWLRRSAAQALGRYFTVRLQFCNEHRLVAIGPYRWVRHPSYAALALIAFGTAMIVRSPMAAVVTLVVWVPSVLLRIHDEESVLRRHLGSAYTEYSSRSWRLVPGIF
jgi:protein-S-isoprenylcysteine O-methyltransferase Ste14